MCAAPQGLVPLAVTVRVPPTATDGALAVTAVRAPRWAAIRSLDGGLAGASPIPANKEVNRNAAINRMAIDRSKRGAVSRLSRGSEPTAGSGLGAGDAVLALHLLLGPVDAAPVLVLGHGHAALHAHTHTRLGRIRFLREPLLEDGHMFSDGEPGAEVCRKTASPLTFCRQTA